LAKFAKEQIQEGTMNYGKLLVSVLVVSAFCFAFTGCGGVTRYIVAGNETKPLYLQNNIHVQEKEGHYIGSYANWTEPASGHIVIPVNSVVDVEYGRTRFYIIEKSTGRKLVMEYNEDKMQMGIDQYLKYIVSPSPVGLETFSEVDRKGIAGGKAYMGMSKNGVRIALGYPARHRTPSLDSNAWVYWRGRFGTLTIYFDNTEKVEGIR
jgi:hypothetical protein